MQQYFSKKRENDILYLDSCDFHHIKNVMRIKSHDSVIVGYDGILYMCLMNEATESRARMGSGSNSLYASVE